MAHGRKARPPPGGPIALPSSQNDQAPMASSSSGTFNPASYTRAFFGSPISWRAGSFGSRFYPGSSPGQLGAPVESVSSLLSPNDRSSSSSAQNPKLSSSIESDRGSLLHALNAIEREDELVSPFSPPDSCTVLDSSQCRNYTCCGLHLHDLHALVDHFEECHVVVLDPYAAPPNAQTAAYPTPPASATFAQTSPNHKPPAYFPPQQPPPHAQGSFDPDDMELDMELDVDTSPTSSSASSPPQTPLHTPLAPYPHHATGFQQHYPQQHPQPPSYQAAAAAYASAPSSPISAFDTTAVMPLPSHPTRPFPSSHAQFQQPPPPAQAFNAYAGYADYSRAMPGTVNPGLSHQHDAANGCVPPALLFGSSTGASGSASAPVQTPASTPSTSRVSSPAIAVAASASGSSAGASGSASTPRASTTLSRPASSLLLSKPFRCPKPNCSKSYKQANGLKYHMTHGSCNFAPPKDLEALQALLAEKGAQRGADGGVMSEGEMREVEREAERRLRPFACGVADCQRRYKNMNGLRYHYQHSGDHGAIGLRLLASGQHECLQHSKSSRHSTPARASTASANANASAPRPTAAHTAPSTPVLQQAPGQQAPWQYFDPQAQAQAQRQYGAFSVAS
ncbi:hypothetical protein DENSPDRAFT_858584 [Dentipellis sp. KUC8613]|nr:hypothetical protein DENSPDRAFT_858584 [Dentipellis sp. KUC8613]